jgi:hypothetical protein
MDQREQELTTRDLAGGSPAEAPDRDEVELGREEPGAPTPADTSRDRDVGMTAGGDRAPDAEGTAALTADRGADTAEDVAAARPAEREADRPASTSEMTAGGRER